MTGAGTATFQVDAFPGRLFDARGVGPCGIPCAVERRLDRSPEGLRVAGIVDAVDADLAGLQVGLEPRLDLAEAA